MIAPDDPALRVLQDAIAKRPDLNVELNVIAWEKYRNVLMETLESEVAPHAALFVPGHLWIPQLAEAGYLAELDSLMSALPASVVEAYDPEDILPTVIEECRYDSRQYQLPFFTDGHLLFYDPDVIEIDSDGNVPIVSTKEIHVLAAKAHNPPYRYGLALKADKSEIFTDFLPYLWEEGGYIFDENNVPHLDNEANVTALERYCSLRKFCPPKTHIYGNAEIAHTLRSGQAALVANWGGQSAPIFLDDTPCRYKAAVFESPWNTTWGIAIPRNQSEDMQLQMLSKLMSLLDKEQDRQITRAAGSPVRKGSYTPRECAQYPWLDAQMAMLSRARELPKDPNLGLFLGDIYEKIYQAFTQVLTPKEALESAQKEAMNYYAL